MFQHGVVYSINCLPWAFLEPITPKTDATAFDFCVFFFICSYASCLVWFRVLKNGFFSCPAQILTESVEKGFIVLFNLVQWNWVSFGCYSLEEGKQSILARLFESRLK